MKKILLVISPAIFALVACGGSEGPGGIDINYEQDQYQPDSISMPDDGSGEGVRDASQDQNVEPCDGLLELNYLDEQDDPLNDYHYKVALNAKRDVRAVVSACGVGQEDVGVVFEVIDESYEGACRLDSSYNYSIMDGLVYVPVQGGGRNGSCVIQACLDDGETCLIFNVAVRNKDPDPLVVEIKQYSGQYAMLDTAKVKLFKGGGACENIPPTATTSSSEFPMLSGQARWKKLPGLEQELVQTYSILAECWIGSDMDKRVRAMGCKDDVTVEYGGSRYVEIDCTDIMPSIKGSYELSSTFDLVSGLPPQVAKVVNVIIGFFQSPTGQILLLMCHPDFGGVMGGDFCGWIFADTQDPKIGEWGTIGGVVTGIIDAHLMGLLQRYCPGDDPELCTNIFKGAGDVGTILKKFRLKSTMTCSQDADKNGLLPMGVCHENWHTVVLKWTLGLDCENSPDPDTCGEIGLNMTSIDGVDEAVYADIEAQIITAKPGYKLAISKHPLNLKYGALVNFAIEKILLPQLFGDGRDGLAAVDSYEDLIYALLAGRACINSGTCCDVFAESVLDKTGDFGGFLTKGLISGACDALATAGATYLRNTLLGLDTTSRFLIGTPLDDPCQLHDHDNNMKFDALGSKTKPCNWDASLDVGGYLYDPKGTFYSTSSK
ncbi:MAG TPA: hypothetical protein PLJ73_01365 [Myxococcota bacterium]|nr:hypothetical protein [Myxococcota bacterium]